MAELTLTELIDTEVVNATGIFFRNKDICEATGASRQHVSQRLKYLHDEGIVEKAGNDWMVVDQGKLVTRLLRAARSQEMSQTKLINGTPENFEALLQSIQLLQNTTNNWKAYAYQLEDALLADINESMENLRNLRSMIKKPPKSHKQVYAHMINSGKYAKKMEEIFTVAAQRFLGVDISDSNVIIDDIRDPALERKELERQNNG